MDGYLLKAEDQNLKEQAWASLFTDWEEKQKLKIQLGETSEAKKPKKKRKRNVISFLLTRLEIPVQQITLQIMLHL